MQINVSDFTGTCVCGKEHQLDVKDILLERGALEKLPELLAKEPYNAYTHLVGVCDENTYEAAGARVKELLPQMNLVIMKAEGLHADDGYVGILKEQLAPYEQIDCFLAIGSGTLHDLTRYVAHERNTPFISIPTAASVDGYVSTVAAMTWKGLKHSMPASSPVAVVADLDVIAAAPMRLTASGVGDLIGKYTALADWRIANMMDGEALCERIFEMEQEALEKLMSCVDGLAAGDVDAIEVLFYGLLLSGLAMQMMGNSRPASGAEHHIAHMWEMHVVNDNVDFLHGEKVTVGLVLVSEIYHACIPYLESGNYELKDSVPIETDLIDKYFTDKVLHDNIIKINDPNLLDVITPEMLREHQADIIEQIKTIPTAETIIEVMRKVDGVATLEDMGFAPEMKPLSARLAPYIRERLTFLRMLKFYSFYEDVIA